MSFLSSLELSRLREDSGLRFTESCYNLLDVPVLLVLLQALVEGSELPVLDELTNDGLREVVGDLVETERQGVSSIDEGFRLEQSRRGSGPFTRFLGRRKERRPDGSRSRGSTVL